MIPSNLREKNLLNPRLWLLVAVVSVVAMGSTAPQCARTTDTPLTPAVRSLDSQGLAECVDACILDAKLQRNDEKIRHVDAVKACEDDEECLDQEEALHESIMEGIAYESQECKFNCHNQGGGFGGQ
jgi:hypothetical protein